jgi:hypothetical protein
MTVINRTQIRKKWLSYASLTLQRFERPVTETYSELPVSYTADGPTGQAKRDLKHVFNLLWQEGTSNNNNETTNTITALCNNQVHSSAMYSQRDSCKQTQSQPCINSTTARQTPNPDCSYTDHWCLCRSTWYIVTGGPRIFIVLLS